MSAGWVAGSVRARAMIQRCLGRTAVRDLAASSSVDAALLILAHSPYGHDIRPEQNLDEAQRAVVGTVVWNLRVLAGWMPREGVTMLRVLLGVLEAANVDDHLGGLTGAEPPAPYRLGLLSTTWPRLARTTSAGELRRVLGTSSWGDPGGDSAREIGLAMRTTLADRVMAAVPPARDWAAGATALLIAREILLQRRELPDRAAGAAARVVGPSALSAASLPEFAAALPASARWAIAAVDDPAELWRAEARWWTRVERDGSVLVRHASPGPEVLVGAVAMMATDAWRVRAALELAARGGAPMEAFDAVA